MIIPNNCRIIKFGGKYYLKAKIKMIASDNWEESNAKIGQFEDTDNLVFRSSIDIPRGIGQELIAIIPTNKIKSKTWYYNMENNKILFSDNELNSYEILYQIISASNKNLNLPKFSMDFIWNFVNSWNNENIIDNVLIEVEAIPTEFDNPLTNPEGLINEESDWELKINTQYNTLRVIKFPNFWNKDDLHLDAMETLVKSLDTPVFRKKLGENSIPFEAVKILKQWIEDNINTI